MFSNNAIAIGILWLIYNSITQSKSLFGCKFANEIIQFIEENLKIDYEQGDC